MSHGRRARVVFELIVSRTGTAELLREGASVWMSDDDPDLADTIGSDFINAANIGAVLDYLVDAGLMTDAQADNCLVDEGSADGEEEEGGEEEDEPVEGEYIPAEEVVQ